MNPRQDEEPELPLLLIFAAAAERRNNKFYDYAGSERDLFARGGVFPTELSIQVRPLPRETQWFLFGRGCEKNIYNKLFTWFPTGDFHAVRI